MNDPRREPPRPDQISPMGGVASALVPQGAVGILGGLFLLVLLGVFTGQVKGPWLALAVAGLAVIAVLILGAVKRELRRDKSPPARREPTLPDDSELSEAERRAAMQRYADERKDET
jgi:hypothetical protein